MPVYVLLIFFILAYVSYFHCHCGFNIIILVLGYLVYILFYSMTFNNDRCSCASRDRAPNKEVI